MINVAIIGATGFTGHELIKILLNHADVNLCYLTSSSSIGKNLNDLYPSLTDCNFILEKYSSNIFKKRSIDFAFVALPHGSAMKIDAKIFAQGTKVIDLSADFRLKNVELYEKYYQPHTEQQLLQEAVFGLPEWYKNQIKDTKLLANPGCYVTSCLLPLLPLANHIDNIIIDTKSGVSGAGKKISSNLLHANVYGNFHPYAIKNHRHKPEIESYLGIPVEFTPHLLPLNRGILSTIYFRSKNKYNELRNLLEDKYKNEPFVHVLSEDQIPNLNNVVGTNNCYLNIFQGSQRNNFIIVSTLDNLIKGASGQAVQNMNIMAGLPEKTGLNITSHYP